MIRSLHQLALKRTELGLRGFLIIAGLAVLRSRPPEEIGDGTPTRCLDDSEGFCGAAQLSGHRKVALIDIAHCGYERTLDLIGWTVRKQALGHVRRLVIEFLSFYQIAFFGL